MITSIRCRIICDITLVIKVNMKTIGCDFFCIPRELNFDWVVKQSSMVSGAWCKLFSEGFQSCIFPWISRIEREKSRPFGHLRY